jgi:glycosyltransferase involved in cell wall biosynthesis
MRVTVVFDNLGPYHLARLRAAAQVCDLTAIEVAASSAEYAWKRAGEARSQKSEIARPELSAFTVSESQPVSISSFQHATLLERGTSRKVSQRALTQKMAAALAASRPDVVFIPGWSSRAAFAALDWCGQNKIAVVAMSESTEWDEPRQPWKEFVKRQLVGLCAGALVGGAPHKDYMVKLGLPVERIFPGYDAVDNGYFARGVEEVRSQKSDVSMSACQHAPYFLASARFIEKKNLPRLIEAYALYREKAETLKSAHGKPSTFNPQPSTAPWPLILLGDGALRPALNHQLSTLNLQPHVSMPGFIQYPELPDYYAGAGAFIHASTTEQWGLVVNEAMASGLPVLVSNRCGCAQDLVQTGTNGFTFDPFNAEELAQLMLKISGFRFPVSDFGAASRRIIANWGTDRFAAGLKAAAECALKAGSKRASLVQRLVLLALQCK